MNGVFCSYLEYTRTLNKNGTDLLLTTVFHEIVFRNCIGPTVSLFFKSFCNHLCLLSVTHWTRWALVHEHACHNSLFSCHKNLPQFCCNRLPPLLSHKNFNHQNLFLGTLLVQHRSLWAVLKNAYAASISKIVAENCLITNCQELPHQFQVFQTKRYQSLD